MAKAPNLLDSQNIAMGTQEEYSPDIGKDTGAINAFEQDLLGSRMSQALYNDEFAKWLESATEVLSNLYTDLTGRQLQADAEGGLIWKRVGKPKCTEECAEFMVMRLRNLLNSNTFMSNFNTEEISRMFITEADTFTFTIIRKADDWKIDPYMQDELQEIFRHHLLAGLNRALDGSEKRLFAIIQRATEMQGYPTPGMPGQYQQPTHLPGFVGKLFGK